MGIHNSTMKAALVILSLSLVAMVQGGDLAAKVMKGINQYNFRSNCWGEENMHQHIKIYEEAKTHCMQVEPPIDLASKLQAQVNPFSPLPASTDTFNPFKQFSETDPSKLQSLWRTKRQSSNSGAGLIDVDEDDFYEFLLDLQNFKGKMLENMGNLTCVLTRMKCLTTEHKINIEYYTNFLTDSEAAAEEGFTFDIEGSAVSDPVWREKMTTAYEDCYSISENWPQSSLNRNPMTRLFGRQKIFFKCASKMEKKLCAKAHLVKVTELLYGPEVLADAEDKYDAIEIGTKVFYHAQNEQEAFVDEFWQNV